MSIIQQLLGWALAVAQTVLIQVKTEITSTIEAVQTAIHVVSTIAVVSYNLLPVRFSRKNRRASISRKFTKAISLKYALARDSLKYSVQAVRRLITLENEKRSYDRTHDAKVIEGRVYYFTNIRWFLFYTLLSIPRGLLFILLLQSPPAVSNVVLEEYLFILSTSGVRPRIPICGGFKKKGKWSAALDHSKEDDKIELPKTGNKLFSKGSQGEKGRKTASILNIINSTGGKYRSLYNIDYNIGDSYCLESTMKELDVINQKYRGGSFEKPIDCHKSMVACGLGTAATDDQVRAFLHAKNIPFIEVTNSAGMIGYWREDGVIQHQVDIPLEQMGYYDVILFSEPCKEYTGGKVKLSKWEPEDSGHISIIKHYERKSVTKAYEDFCSQCGELGIVHGECTSCKFVAPRIWKVKSDGEDSKASKDNSASSSKGDSSSTQVAPKPGNSGDQTGVPLTLPLPSSSTDPNPGILMITDGEERRAMAGPGPSQTDYEEVPKQQVVSKKGKEPETNPVSGKEEGAKPMVYGPPPRVPRPEESIVAKPKPNAKAAPKEAAKPSADVPKPKPKAAPKEAAASSAETSAKLVAAKQPPKPKAAAKTAPLVAVKTDTDTKQDKGDDKTAGVETPKVESKVQADNALPLDPLPSSSISLSTASVENPLSSSPNSGAQTAPPAKYDHSIRYEHLSSVKGSTAVKMLILREVGASVHPYGAVKLCDIKDMSKDIDFVQKDHFFGYNEIKTEEEEHRSYLVESFSRTKPQFFKTRFFRGSGQSEGDYVQMSELHINFKGKDRVSDIPDDRLVTSCRVWGNTSSVEEQVPPATKLNVEMVKYSRSSIDTFSVGFISSAYESIRPIDKHCAHCDFVVMPVFGTLSRTCRGVANHMDLVNRILARYLSNGSLMPKSKKMEEIFSQLPKEIRFAVQLTGTSHDRLLSLASSRRTVLSLCGVPISRFVCFNSASSDKFQYDVNSHTTSLVRQAHSSNFGCIAYFCSFCHDYLPLCGKLYNGSIVCEGHRVCNMCGDQSCPKNGDDSIQKLVEERAQHLGKHMVSTKVESGLCSSVIYDANGKPELKCFPRVPKEFEISAEPIVSEEENLPAGNLEIIIPKVWKGKAFVMNVLTYPFFQGPDCKAYQYERNSMPACLLPFKHAELLPWASRTFGMCGDVLKPNKIIEWMSPSIDNVESEKGTSKPVESSWSWGKKRMWRSQASYTCNGGALVYHNNGPIHPKTAYGVWTDYSGRDEKRPLLMMWSNKENPLDNDRFCFPNYQDNVVEEGTAVTYSWKKISSKVFCSKSVSKSLLDSQDQLKTYETSYGNRDNQGGSPRNADFFVRDGRIANFVVNVMEGVAIKLPWNILNKNGLHALNVDVYIPIRTATHSKIETVSMKNWSDCFNFSCCHPTGVDKNGVVCNETRVCLKCWNCTGGLNCYGLKNFEYFNMLAMLTRVDVSERYNLANYLLLNYKAKSGGMEGFTEYRSMIVNAANALMYLPPRINQHYLPNTRSAENKRNKYDLPMLSLQDNQDALEHHMAASVFIKGRTPYSIVTTYDRLLDSLGGRENVSEETLLNTREYKNLQCDALEYVQSLHTPDMINLYSSVLRTHDRPSYRDVNLDRFSYVHKRIYDMPPGMTRLQHYELIISSGNRPIVHEGPFFGENLSDYPVKIEGRGKHKRKGLPIFDPSAQNIWRNNRTGAFRRCLICQGYAPEPHRWEAGICVTCADKSNHRPTGIEEQLATIATFHQPEGVYNLAHPVKVQPATPYYKKKPTREGLKINEQYKRDHLGFKFPRTERLPRTSQPAHLIGFTTATRATVYNTSEGLDIELNTVLNRFMAKPLDEPRDGQFSKLFSVCKDLGLLGPQGALQGKTMKFCRLHHHSIVSDLVRTKASKNRAEAVEMAECIIENALMLNSLVWNVENYNPDLSEPDRDKGHTGTWINTFEPRKRSGYWKALSALRKADLMTAINVARDKHEKQLSYPLIDFSFFLKRELERHCAPPHTGKREAMNPRIICNPCPISQVIMGPILRPATSYLHKIWHNKSVLSYAGGMTPFQMRAWAEDNVDVDNIGRMFFRRGADHIGIENDFSKFDCTYSKEAFEFVLNVYKYWGLPVNSPLFVHVWNGWLVPVGKFHSGFKVTCAVMNASGRSDTALMNALINGCVQIVSYLCVMQTTKCNCPIVPVKPTATCPRNHRMIYRLDMALAKLDLQKIRIIVLGDDSLTICPDIPNIQQRIGEEIAMYGFEARDMKTHRDPRMMVFLGSRLYPAYIRSDRIPTLHPCWGKTIGRAMFKMGTASEVQDRPFDWLLGNMEATLRTSAHVPILSDIARKTIQVLAARGLNPGTHSDAAAEAKIRSSYVTWLDTKTLNIIPAEEAWPLYLSEVYNMCPSQYSRFLSMLDEVVSPTFLINFRPLEVIVQQDTVGL